VNKEINNRKKDYVIITISIAVNFISAIIAVVYYQKHRRTRREMDEYEKYFMPGGGTNDSTI